MGLFKNRKVLVIVDKEGNTIKPGIRKKDKRRHRSEVGFGCVILIGTFIVMCIVIVLVWEGLKLIL